MVRQYAHEHVVDSVQVNLAAKDEQFEDLVSEFELEKGREVDQEAPYLHVKLLVHLFALNSALESETRRNEERQLERLESLTFESAVAIRVRSLPNSKRSWCRDGRPVWSRREEEASAVGH